MDDRLIEEWRERVVGLVASFDLGRIDPLWTQRYAVAVDDLDPVYFDRQAAQQRGLKDIIAPPNYLATLRTAPQPGPTEGDLLEDGTSPDGRPDLPGLQIMGGGQSIEFVEPVYCGEEIRCDKKVKSITKREGKQGVMVIVEEELVYRNIDSNIKMILLNRAIYRYVGEETSDA